MNTISNQNFKLVSIINKLNFISFIGFLSTLPFEFPSRKPFLIAFFVTYIFEFLIERKWTKFNIGKREVYFISFIVFVAFMFLYYPWEMNNKYFVILRDRRLSLAAFGFIGVFGVNKYFNIKYILYTLMLTGLGYVLYIIFYRIGFSNFIFSQSPADLFNKSRDLYINSHISFNFTLNLALISVCYILSCEWRRNIILVNSMLIFIGLILFSVLLASDGRCGYLSSILIVLFFILRQFWLHKRWIAYILIVLIPFLLLFSFRHHKRTDESHLKMEPRHFIWKNAFDLIKVEPIIGYGAATAQSKLDSIRLKRENSDTRKCIVWNKWDIVTAHDQYLQTTLEFGFFGLLFLLIIYLSPIFLVVKSRRFLSIMVVMICLIQSSFECFLTTLDFSMVFGALAVILLCLPLDRNLQENNS